MCASGGSRVDTSIPKKPPQRVERGIRGSIKHAASYSPKFESTPFQHPLAIYVGIPLLSTVPLISVTFYCQTSLHAFNKQVDAVVGPSFVAATIDRKITSRSSPWNAYALPPAKQRLCISSAPIRSSSKSRVRFYCALP